VKSALSVVLILATMMSTCCINVGAEEHETVDVYINGELLETDQPAILVNSRTMVPLRAIAETLNCDVDYNEAEQRVLITNPVCIISMIVDDWYLYKKAIEDKKNNGEATEPKQIVLDSPSMIMNNRTLVPLRAVSESLNAEVEWKEFENRVDITMEYDWIFDFENGYALVEKDGKRGMINEKRELVVPLKYSQVIGFYEGCTTVMLNGKEGMVDITGKEVLPCEYETVSRVLDGYASVKKDGKWGSVDAKGNIVVPCIYDEKVVFIVNTTMSHMKNRARVVRDGKWGYVNTEGKEIVPCIYETSTEALQVLMGI